MTVGLMVVSRSLGFGADRRVESSVPETMKGRAG
jgi:hypothetical protein